MESTKLAEILRGNFTPAELAEIYAYLQPGSGHTGCKTLMDEIEKAFHNNMSLLNEAMNEAGI